ncbi:MAG: hypothetical protein V1874_12575 [Spirochaetota bacterium]
MELNEIIKTDKDRLFILDNECFIIFTADNISDEKPFIRIGNWIDLPPESIPLIENIIVTDSITGNPAHEQFNIDPQFLSTNRYIGSSQVVYNYLSFQKDFGLDLNNASVVDVEKDLPNFSKEKSISSKDSFLGIFYRNGNFRVIYKDENLFDLNEFENKYQTSIKRHDLVSDKNKALSAYTGSGIIVIDNSAIFYKNRFFTAYLFPKEYLDIFDKLNIDPAKIRELILPAGSIAGITDFLKWINSRKSLIKIFFASKSALIPVQKLFPSAVIKANDFHGHSFETGDGLSVHNYPGSLNEKLTYKNVVPSRKKLELGFIKEYTGIQEILKEKLDGIIVPFTIYEQASLYFNSSDTTVLCVDDGNKNISKLKDKDIIILNRKVKYEFNKFEDDDLLQNALKTISNKEIIEFIESKNTEEIKRILFNNIHLKDTLEFADIKDFLNIISILRIFLNTTTDRKFSADVRKIVQKAVSLFDKEAIISQDIHAVKISLYFYKHAVFEFYDSSDMAISQNTEAADALSGRIQTDRIRFKELLELYKKTQTKSKKELTSLHDEISRRKTVYNTEELLADHKQLKRNILKMRLKKISKVALLLLIIALLSLVSVKGFNYFMDYRESKKIEREKQEKLEAERIKTEKEKKEKAALVEKYHIRVSDRDIYIYANKVARKNGYREIEYKDLKEKNPNWIFPGNVFYLMDGEKVNVIAGDTLWDISDKKLMETQFELYKLIEKIDAAKSKTEKAELLAKAQGFAFSQKHFKKIDEIKQTLK